MDKVKTWAKDNPKKAVAVAVVVVVVVIIAVF